MINKFRFKNEALTYLYQQLELGFKPQWVITYHYFTAQELLKLMLETNNEHGYRDRYGLRCNKNLWNQVARDKWIDRRRKELDWIVQDTGQIKNVELKELYGVKRLDSLDRYSVPPMLFFHELGQVKYQYHTHQILSDVPSEFNDQKTLHFFFNNDIRPKRKCFSKWKKIDVTKIYEPEGLIDYLVKETNIRHLSPDLENSLVIHPKKLIVT